MITGDGRCEIQTSSRETSRFHHGNVTYHRQHVLDRSCEQLCVKVFIRKAANYFGDTIKIDNNHEEKSITAFCR